MKGVGINETNKHHSFDHSIGPDIIIFMRSFPDLLYPEWFDGADDIHWQSHIGRYRCCAAYGGYRHLSKAGLYHHT